MRSSQSIGGRFEIAPLTLNKTSSVESLCHNQYLNNNLFAASEMTPPHTPSASMEDLAQDIEGSPKFHDFLRAFYPFQPSCAMSDSTVTLPLTEGDVVMVHSIHTNGWADGTLLASGARGWLPTNYCEAYEPDEMRNLLKSLLNFWDLLRSSSANDKEIFGNQEFMKGIIAGIRFLLQRTNCLGRESIIVQRSDTMRRCRKQLMSELSSLVKTAKRMQEAQNSTTEPLEDLNDIVDEMILTAFKIILKAVRFVDHLEEDRRARAPASVTVMDTVAEESYVPSTPPSDKKSVDCRVQVSDAIVVDVKPETSRPESMEVEKAAPAPVTARFSKRISSLPPTRAESPQFSTTITNQGKRQSMSISHRLSMAGPIPGSRQSHLASQRLSRSHDSFLSQLGSFIGRLHLQSQSRPELASAVRQCAISGGELLAVIESVSDHSQGSSLLVAEARVALFESIQDLVFAARDTLVNAATEDADFIMPHDNSKLLSSATSCVRAAGDCSAKTRTAIERAGDFEFEPESTELGIDLTMLDDVPVERERKQSVTSLSDSASPTVSNRSSMSTTPPVSQPTQILEKPLPDIPDTQGSEELVGELMDVSRPASQVECLQSLNSSFASTHSLPKLSTTVDTPKGDDSPAEHMVVDQDFESHSHYDIMIASSAGSSATYLSRDSEISLASQTSTRATTPDQGLAPRNMPSMSELSASGSFSQTEEDQDMESRLMEKTFAHELMFNREGQVTGGSLPALVERLTAHEAAPDAMFVSTFYLTFRLFCTPTQFAESLIDRFEYISESPHVANPVRLRVYNAFKGWMETHWRDQTDRDALTVIIPFAQHRLSAVLSTAGRRLLELAHRVSGGGSLVPRLVSSMGKTNTSIAQFIPADTPIPSPIISKSQQNVLVAFKTGGNLPAILDFEPLEIARQLTIKQMTIFCSILPEELLSSQWMKNNGAEAPNVKAMSSLSTDISNLVADTILEHQEIKKRAAVIKQWIKIANSFLELHNYDGLMAVICSLNSSTISRLRKTWDLVSNRRREMLRTLQSLVEPSQNHKILRTRLHDHVPPCLPFLGMYLTDLTFVDIGNHATKQLSAGNDAENQRASGLTVVNYDKHTRTAKIIGELQRFQIPYRLSEVSDLQDWLSARIDKVREGDQSKVQFNYYRKSLKLEPRETTIRTPAEPTPIIQNSSRTDLFGWMRSGGGQNISPTQI